MTNIDQYEQEWLEQHPGEEYNRPHDSGDDIDNLFLARFFACVSDMENSADKTMLCERMGIQYHYEQLHMCCWFSSQITKGGGHYSRSQANYSARTTYNRLMNPNSLLWIGVIMGVEQSIIKIAAEEMMVQRSAQAKCSVVRKNVPFDLIRARYQKLMYEE